MLSVTPVHEPFSTEGHLDGPKVIHNSDSNSTEVHNLGRQFLRFFSGLYPLNPTKRAYGPEQMGVPVPRKWAAYSEETGRGKGPLYSGRNGRPKVPARAARFRGNGRTWESSRAAHHTGVMTGRVL